VLNLFKFFQLEKARGRPFYSPDNLIKRTCKAAGISYSSVYRVVNGKSPPESNRPKERKKTLDDFDRCFIKRTNTMFLQTFDKSFVLPILAMFIYAKMSKNRFMKKFYVNF
jgi:hypothetical protein